MYIDISGFTWCENETFEHESTKKMKYCTFLYQFFILEYIKKCSM